MHEDPDNWAFPDEDDRFSLGIHLGDPRSFFGPSPDRDRLLAERKHWLTEDPNRYAAALPEATEALVEVESLAQTWGLKLAPPVGPPWNRLLNLGRQLEPDLVLLTPGEAGKWKVVAGCVCFPSYWRLTDKIGIPIEDVHDPVPGLNPSLGPAIHRYLSQMKAGGCWFRANWGLASRPDLNEHPDRGRHPWPRPLSLEQIWLRREDQAILSLPASGGVLFGIRVVVRSVAEVVQSSEKRRRLVRGLRTMPAELVRYKGIEKVHNELLTLLEAANPGD